MTAHLTIALGTTFCPDTPANWHHFHRLKDRVLNNRPTPHKSSSTNDRNKALQHQISHENKALRSLRAFLPGHEPDGFY